MNLKEAVKICYPLGYPKKESQLFLVCRKDGDVIDIIHANTLEEAIEDSVGRNGGEFVAWFTPEMFQMLRDVIEE